MTDQPGVARVEAGQRVTPRPLATYEALRYREHRAWIRSRRGTFTMEEARSAGRGRSTTRQDR